MQGFKSFATRTVFVFDAGLTAIIGPNGSGKSNISDGVRWVLGEQSHSLLRSKKTEDVIFAGGHGRAPAGLAEVAVTFDNSAGWLPIDFSEVTITRRAYRSGENQYLINGRRVRLKDVHQLTASLGHSYTVVGQGLVDAALSQRAEERRGLFEHAADLTGLRLKAAEAERNLNEAESNTARMLDLLSELEPRLRTLERAAKQAREWQSLRDRLRHLQIGYYRIALAETRQTLQKAEEASAIDADRLASVRAQVQSLAEDLVTARREAEEARAVADQHAVHLQSATEHERRIVHERELANERLVALNRRREDMADTHQGLDEQAAGVERDRAEAELQIAQLDRQLLELRGAIEQLQARISRGRDTRAARERQALNLAAAGSGLERRLADLGRRRALLEQQQERDQIDRDRATQASQERTERIDRLVTELRALDDSERERAEELKGLEQTIVEIHAQVDTLVECERYARSDLEASERAVTEASARLEALQRIQASGAGLFAGVQEVLTASRQGALTGIRGTVAELISLSSNYETAIEVALGSHLQDIVVDRWRDAETAIDHLKRERRGRATFQPIETVKGREITLSPAVLVHQGVHGIAAELVTAEPDVTAITRSLLGRTLVVDDLAITRAVLGDLPMGWNLVTLSGEIARTGGSVTGGAAVRESGMLGRERELRELPLTLERLAKERDRAKDELEQTRSQLLQLTERRRSIEGERVSLQATQREQASQRSRLERWLEELSRDNEGADQRSRALATATEQARASLLELEGEEAVLQRELGQAREARAVALEDLSEDQGHLTVIEEEMTSLRQQQAALEERFRAERQRLTSLQAQRSALSDELRVRAERAAELDGQLVALTSQRDRLAQEAEALGAQRVQLEGERRPLEEASKETGARLKRTEEHLDRARQQLLDAERAHGGQELGVERIRSELMTLRQRIMDDLELDDPDQILDSSFDSDDDFSGAEPEITRLKERLRRVGYVGEEAVEEFERESERHQFLRTQLNDVQGAAAALRSLLDDLRGTMRQRFDETFQRVAVAFIETFTTLFGGGSAQLILTSGEEREGAGIDIVAQPPGKRLQSLALLSGGERALTAAALLFAILRVNPTPFCLLDEVDAALDEANIVRFRDQLLVLASESQAIIITHNRGTIEVADSIYGISMREDGVSQALSLRMSEAIAAG
jgi:chromosome segregation protein